MNQLPLFAAGDKSARAPRPTEPIIRSAEIELPYRWLMRRALLGIRMTVEDDEHGRVPIQPQWHCLGTNSDGSPIHPLARGRNRVPDDMKLQPWRNPYHG